MAAMDSDTQSTLAQRLSPATKRRPARPVADIATSIQGLRRQLRSLSHRPDREDAGVNDVIDLPALEAFAALVEDARQAERDAVAHLRAQGYSWTDIGQAIGITKQSAQQRFGTSQADRQARLAASMTPLF